jgi:polyphosphate kinase 2 (PPK2 family)
VEIRKVNARHREPTLQKRRYFCELLRLQGELIKLQDWAHSTGEKIAILRGGVTTGGTEATDSDPPLCCDTKRTGVAARSVSLS